MSTPPAGISEADWLATPASVRTLILAQQQEIQALRQENVELRSQLTALASELAQLREQIGRSSRNSSKLPSSDGPGFKPFERHKGSGRKRGGQTGHPGPGPELLPIERVHRWWNTTRMPAAVAARCWRVRIRIPYAIS